MCFNFILLPLNFDCFEIFEVVVVVVVVVDGANAVAPNIKSLNTFSISLCSNFVS